MTSSAPYAEVIGDPIKHSKSPKIHNFWLDKLGMDGNYRRHQVARGGLADYLAARQADPDWRGCNVTMPLKLDALAAADSKTDHALAAGASNLLVPSDDGLVAGNSDVTAIATLLGTVTTRTEGSLILYGNGGAARAVLTACKRLGINDVQIQARNLSKARKLAVEYQLAHEPRPLDSEADGVGIVNATPLGMVGHQCLNCDVAALAPDGFVFDMVSSPARTPLLDAAAERGLQVIDGIDMLVEQAARGFKLFFDADAPREHDAQLKAMLR